MGVVYSSDTTSFLLQVPTSYCFIIRGGEQIFATRMEDKGSNPVIMSGLGQSTMVQEDKNTKILNGWPPCANHKRTVLSLDPVATNFACSTLVFWDSISRVRQCEYQLWCLRHIGKVWIRRYWSKYGAFNDMLMPPKLILGIYTLPLGVPDSGNLPS